MSIEPFLGSLNSFKRIFESNLGVSNEKVLIIGDSGVSGNLASPILSSLFKKSADELGLKSELVLQGPKVKGEEADHVLVESLRSLPEGSVIVMNMSGLVGRLGNLGLSYRKYCKEKGHRFTSASGLGAINNDQLQTFINAYDVDYEEISKKAHKIKNMIDNAEELHITTKAGTDLLFNVEGMEAKVSDGLYREPGVGGNLPGSETYVAPRKNKVNGTIVIDACMRIREGAKLVEEPFELKVEKGEVVEISGKDEALMLEKTLQWAHDKSRFPWGVRRIGEFGLGLNPKASIIGCTVLDEKTLGTGHFAIGSNYWFGGSVYAIIHLDQVFKDPVVKVDGKPLLLE